VNYRIQSTAETQRTQRKTSSSPFIPLRRGTGGGKTSCIISLPIFNNLCDLGVLCGALNCLNKFNSGEVTYDKGV